MTKPRIIRHFIRGLFLTLLATAAASPAFSADTLKIIRDRGRLICGTSAAVPGFSIQNATGRWEGFDVDICRALAAAIFDDSEKVTFISLSSKDRLIALQSGEIDVLPRTTTWTLGRSSSQGVMFTGVNYYDGQGFLVRKKLGVKTASQLGGASICVPQGTTSELNMADFFRKIGQKYEPASYATTEEAIAAYETGRCDGYTTDISSLAGNILKLKDPDEHMILPDVISKEPLGAWVRTGDDSWFNLVRFTLLAMINAEELGVTKANVSQMQNSENPELRRFLGKDGKFGEALGVTNDWVVRIIQSVGNYGESYDRYLGKNSLLKLQRGPNELWTKGGLQYSPPFR